MSKNELPRWMVLTIQTVTLMAVVMILMAIVMGIVMTVINLVM